MSKLSKLPNKVLFNICQNLIDEAKFNYDEPYDDYDENQEYLEQAANWTGEKIEHEDVEFISVLISDNFELFEKVKEGEIDKKAVIEELVKPQLYTYSIDYEVWGPATLTEKYEIKRKSYSESLAKDGLKHDYFEGNMSYYDGDYQENESDNFEPDNFDITWVNQVQNENKKSILSKIVVENTTEVLDNLDKKTLIELRNIINQKLSSL